MSRNDSDHRWLLAFLVGAGVGALTALLLEPASRNRLRSLLADGACDAAAAVKAVRQGPDAWRNRKSDRAGREIRQKVERIRSAGF